MNAIVKAPLDGEIILPGDSITVRAALHPMKMAHVTVEVPAGLTISEIIERVREEAGQSTHLKHGLIVELSTPLGSEEIAREHWDRVRVKPGVDVMLRATAGKGFGGLLKSLLLVGLMVLAPFVAPLIGISAGILQAGVAVIGIALNVLFPTRPPQLRQDKTKTTYSIGGGKNQRDPYGPVSLILGRIRVVPDLAANWYTELHGDDQYLRGILCWGIGPLDITDIKIGETRIEEYDDYEIQTYYGYPDDPDPTLYPSQVLEESLSVDLKHSTGWVTRTTTDDITEISLDFVWPQGLIEISNKKGKRRSRSVSISVQYRALYDEGAWTTLGTLSFSAKTQDVIRKSIRSAVPKGRYDVRVSKTSTDYDGDDRTVAETLTWTALRGMRNDSPLHFQKPVAISAIRIRATSQLNGVIDNFNGICTSKVKAYDEASDTWVDDTKSRNPADLIRHIWQGTGPTARPKPDSKTDIEGLERFHRFCTLKGYTFDQERDFVASGLSTIQDIAAAGRAVPIIRDGMLSVVWDEADAPVVQWFTPRNSWGFSSSRKFYKLPHALRVRFINAKRGYLDDERLVFADGYDKSNATLYETIEFPGITDPDLVWKFGRYHFAQIQLRPETHSLTADVEHLIAMRGDRVGVAHDVIKIGLVQARVKLVTETTVTLDDQVIMDPDKSYGIEFRHQYDDNTLSSFVRKVAYVDGFTNTLTFDDDGTDLPSIGDLAMFGESGKETAIFRLLRVKPGKDFSADLDLVDDAPDIQNADTGTIPPYDSQITQPVDPKTIRPTIDEVVESVTTDGTVLPVTTLVWHPAATTSPVSYEVVKRYDEGGSFGAPDTVSAPVNRMSWVDIAPGSYTFRVCAIFADGSRSTWAELQTYVLSSEKVPPDVDNLAINALGDVATISWDAPDEPVAFLELRYSPATSGATWQAAAPLVLRATGTSLQTALNSGTYLAKFVSGSGGYSENASEIIVTNGAISSMNVAEDLYDLSTFDGTFDDTYETDETVRLTYAQDIFEYEDLFDVPDIFLGTEGIADEGTYTIADRIDLGAVFTARVSAEVMASGVSLNSDIFALPDLFEVSDLFGADPASWAVTIQMRTTNDDPTADSPAPTWTDWFPLVIGDYTARAFEFRLLLESFEFGVTPAVQSFHARVDMPDRFEKGKDLVVPTTGLRVDFDPAFLVLKGIARFDQDLATGDYAVVSNKDESGFDISYKDASGDAVERTFDFVAAGYGAVIDA